MHKPLVSVIIPVYNAEKFLEETIESVLNQTYKNIELLLINHNSSDQSVTIMELYKKKYDFIKLINLEINKGGPAYPRNIGIDNAKGEYIAFLDADDVWLNNKLEKQVEVLNQFPEIHIVHSLSNTIDENSNLMGFFNNQKTHRVLKYFFSDFKSLCISNHTNINTVLLRNKSICRFRESKNLIALEDWAFIIDNVHNKKKYLIEDVLINYRVHSSSLSNRKTITSYIKAFYLSSLLLNEEKISLFDYFLFCSINLLKIILKKIK